MKKPKFTIHWVRYQSGNICGHFVARKGVLFQKPKNDRWPFGDPAIVHVDFKFLLR